MVDPTLMSDEVLLSVCVRYGEEARKWRNKFLGMLPEVNRRRLYEREGCSSVVEFAKKVGGVSEEQVQQVLRLKEKFEEVPVLQELLVSGTVSMHKLERVASVAGVENQEFLANQVQMLSRRAVDTLVRDLKHADINSLSGQRSALPTISETMQISVMVDADIGEQLQNLQERGIDINAELRVFLEQRKREIQQEKEEIAATCGPTSSRYIPAKIRNVIGKEYGMKCSRTGCNKPSVDTHHEKRWSLDPTHDPHYLAPLCEEHHEIAHTIDVKYQEYKKRKQ